MEAEKKGTGKNLKRGNTHSLSCCGISEERRTARSAEKVIRNLEKSIQIPNIKTDATIQIKNKNKCSVFQVSAETFRGVQRLFFFLWVFENERVGGARRTSKLPRGRGRGSSGIRGDGGGCRGAHRAIRRPIPNRRAVRLWQRFLHFVPIPLKRRALPAPLN